MPQISVTIARVAKWLRRLTSDQKIEGSSPFVGTIFFSRVVEGEVFEEGD